MKLLIAIASVGLAACSFTSPLAPSALHVLPSDARVSIPRGDTLPLVPAPIAAPEPEPEPEPEPIIADPIPVPPVFVTPPDLGPCGETPCPPAQEFICPVGFHWAMTPPTGAVVCVKD